MLHSFRMQRLHSVVHMQTNAVDPDGPIIVVGQAAKWFRKAAEQGNTSAEENLGVISLSDHDVLTRPPSG